MGCHDLWVKSCSLHLLPSFDHRGLSFSSSSFESFAVLCSMVHIYHGDLLDEARGHLVCCICFLNFEILTLEVNTSYTLVGISCSGIF
jgi:hypothetical protein